jgi:hypothetical protein
MELSPKYINVLGHKSSLNKFKKIEETPCILSDQNGIKLNLNNKRNHRKYSNSCILNSTALKDKRVTEKIREEIKKFLEINENENAIYQDLHDTAKVILRGMFLYISAYIKNTETSQINNLIMYLKVLEKTKTNKSRERNNKDQS